MIRLLTIISIILAVVLFPPASLALISNNAIPGDKTYPIKIGLEDIIYMVASISPTSKAWFSGARSDRRFQELNILATEGKQTGQTLNDLVEQTQITANQIANVSDQDQKTKLIEQLSASIEKYDKGLEKISSVEPAPAPITATIPIEPESTVRPSASATPRATSTPSPTPTPTPTSTSIPTPRATTTPRPTPTPIPTPTPRPTPVATPEPGRQVFPCDKITNDIRRARCELERIRDGLGAASPSPQETGKQGRDQDRGSDRRNNDR